MIWVKEDLLRRKKKRKQIRCAGKMNARVDRSDASDNISPQREHYNNENSEGELNCVLAVNLRVIYSLKSRTWKQTSASSTIYLQYQ